jgi:hypothetical protein
MTAVVIAPAWRRQPWSAYLTSMTVRSQVLGASDQALIRGKEWEKREQSYPQAAWRRI